MVWEGPGWGPKGVRMGVVSDDTFRDTFMNKVFVKNVGTCSKCLFRGSRGVQYGP